MWRLQFPFFALKIITASLLTVLELAVFRVTAKRIVALNIFLTALIAVLCWLWLQMPDAKPAVSFELGISLRATPETIPVPVSLETLSLQETLQEYGQLIDEKNFVSQADYINGAILADTAQQYQLADTYLRLARYIDPNREFFTD